MIIIASAPACFLQERGKDGVHGAAAAGGAEEDDDDHDDELGDPAAAFVAELVGEDTELRLDGFSFSVESDALLFQLGEYPSQPVFLPHPLLLPPPTIFVFPLTLPFVPPNLYLFQHGSHDFGLFLDITCYQGRVAFQSVESADDECVDGFRGVGARRYGTGV